ncbi:hypothetical protein GH157_02590 [archaeon]|nr:hypothetical protein [archaeon]
MGPVDLQDYYFEHKLQQVDAMNHAIKVIPEVDAAYEKISGRSYGLLHSYMMEDAEVALLGLGATMGTIRIVVDELRKEGVKAGLIRMRVYRPFPRRLSSRLWERRLSLGFWIRPSASAHLGGPCSRMS